MEKHVIDSAGVYRGPRITIIPPSSDYLYFSSALGYGFGRDTKSRILCVSSHTHRHDHGYNPPVMFIHDPEVITVRMPGAVKYYHGFNH